MFHVDGSPSYKEDPVANLKGPASQANLVIPCNPLWIRRSCRGRQANHSHRDPPMYSAFYGMEGKGEGMSIEALAGHG